MNDASNARQVIEALKNRTKLAKERMIYVAEHPNLSIAETALALDVSENCIFFIRHKLAKLGLFVKRPLNLYNENGDRKPTLASQILDNPKLSLKEIAEKYGSNQDSLRVVRTNLRQSGKLPFHREKKTNTATYRAGKILDKLPMTTSRAIADSIGIPINTAAYITYEHRKKHGLTKKARDPKIYEVIRNNPDTYPSKLAKKFGLDRHEVFLARREMKARGEVAPLFRSKPTDHNQPLTAVQKKLLADNWKTLHRIIRDISKRFNVDESFVQESVIKATRRYNPDFGTHYLGYVKRYVSCAAFHLAKKAKREVAYFDDPREGDFD